MTLRAVRTATHAGFDRVVFEFAGDTLPSYHAAYVDRPVRQCGSGRTVVLGGEAALEIRFYTARAHTEAGQPTVADRERVPALPVLEALALTCDFEGNVTWGLGLAGPRPYRVQRLRAPARVVVDVQPSP